MFIPFLTGIFSSRRRFQLRSLTVYDGDEIVPDIHIAVFVAIIISGGIFGMLYMREVSEMKTHFQYFVLVHCDFSVDANIHHDPAVFPQDIIDITHEVIVVAVEPVVVAVTTLVGAEFFVGAAIQAFTAIFTNAFHLRGRLKF
jgi:hypothetical protein